MQIAGVVRWELKIKNVRRESYRDTRGPGNNGYRAPLKVAKAQKPEKALRDIAILYLLHFMGLRRSEVANLDLSDIDFERNTLAVLGKRRNEKMLLTIPHRTKEALQEWIGLRCNATGPLFYNLNHDTERRTRLSGEGLRHLVAGLGRKAGIKVTPHGLRHLAITNVLDMGVGIREAQRFSRHADPETLMKYNDNREDLAGKVAQQLEDLHA
jgi:integrase/recombinase XerC